jgi:hypothetical protein
MKSDPPILEETQVTLESLAKCLSEREVLRTEVVHKIRWKLNKSGGMNILSIMYRCLRYYKFGS